MIKFSDFQPACPVDWYCSQGGRLFNQGKSCVSDAFNKCIENDAELFQHTHGNSANIRRFFDVRSAGASHKAGTSKDELFINTHQRRPPDFVTGICH